MVKMSWRSPSFLDTLKQLANTHALTFYWPTHYMSTNHVRVVHIIGTRRIPRTETSFPVCFHPEATCFGEPDTNTTGASRRERLPVIRGSGLPIIHGSGLHIIRGSGLPIIHGSRGERLLVTRGSPSRHYTRIAWSPQERYCSFKFTRGRLTW